MRNCTMRNIYAFLILFSISLAFIKCEMSADNVMIAINCGGEAHKDSRGILYEQDNYFSGGQSSDFGANFEIKLTNDADVYQTERWGSEDFSYDIPLNQSGKFVLVLKFSEVYFNSPSEKIFDVSLGKETIIRHLDIYSKVGKAVAYDEFVEFEIKNNKVYMNGKVAEGAYDEENGTLKVSFKKGERDNPKINALVLVKGTLADTDYEQFKMQFEDLERQKQEKERKQREFKKKSNDYDYEDFEDDFVDVGGSVVEKGSALFSPSGILLLCVAGFLFYSLILKSKKHDKEE